MLKWLWRRKKQDEDPARKVERLKEELQQKYDERERIRKAQSMLMENPSWLQLDEWIHRADLDSWLLRERAVYESRRLKKKMKLAKLSRKNRLPVELNAPIQSEPENIVKVDSPFMMHDVMQPVTSPGQAKKARKNQSK